VEGGRLMQLYRVIFHFDNDNAKTLHVEGENEQDVLNTIYAQGDFYDGTVNKGKGFFRINLKQVTYISIYDK
jgi:hypothetical protein